MFEKALKLEKGWQYNNNNNNNKCVYSLKLRGVTFINENGQINECMIYLFHR